jgi:hypothetical protein
MLRRNGGGLHTSFVMIDNFLPMEVCYVTSNYEDIRQGRLMLRGREMLSL